MYPFQDRFSKALAFCAGLIALNVAARLAGAADVNLIVNCSSTQSWLTPAVWSDGNAPAAGNTYFVGRSRNNQAIAGTLRTPAITGNATFAGDALYINSTGAFANKTNGTLTLGDLFVTSGSIGVWNGNQTQTIVANRMSFHGPVALGSVASAANDKRIAVLTPTAMDGDGTLTLTLNPDSANDDGVTFQPQTNTFSGAIVQNGGQSTFGTSAALGNAALLRVNYGGKVAFSTDATNIATSLNLATTSSLNLNKNLQFKAVTINGVQLADGTYPASALAATYPKNIVDGGGTLTVGSSSVNAIRRPWLFE